MERAGLRATPSPPLRGSPPGSSRRVVFDVGGVLVRTDRKLFHRAIESLAGREVDPRDCAAFLDSALVRSYECGGMPDAEFLTELGSWFRIRRVSESRARATWSAILTGPTDLHDVLQELPDDAWLVASNTNPIHWRTLLDGWLPPTVDARAVLSFRVGSRKPDEGFFRAMLRYFDADGSPSSILFVDDCRENVEVASAMGMRGVQARSTDASATRREVREWLE